jgi:Spy/CpxP family protein refolding chaperone
VRRITPLGWLLVAALVATAVLALAAPGAALVAAIVLALVAAAAVADGFGGPVSWFDVDVANDRKREALSRRLKLGRRRWEQTAPDHADEPADAIWERERERRGLG